MSIRALPLVLCLLGVPSMTSAQNITPLPFEEGDRFPDINLPALEDGRAVSIQDYQGTKLILHIFASW